MVKIGQDELYPSTVDELLFSIPDILDYQVTLATEGEKDALKIKIEVVKEDENIQKSVNHMLLNHPLIRKNLSSNLLDITPIEFAGQGSLARMNRAKKLIFDNRRSTA